MSAKRELNLLPESRQVSLRRQRLIAGMRSLSLTIFLGALFLTGTGGGVWAWAEWMTRNIDISVLDSDVENYKRLQASVESYNGRLGEINLLDRERIVWSRVTRDLLEVVPAGITINRVSVNEEIGVIVLGGVAVNRIALIAWEEALKNLSWAEEVEAPNRNLLERTNSLYEFSIKIK